MAVLGWVLLGVLVALGARHWLRRRDLESGARRRCPHCGHPNEANVTYCASCGQVVRSGSLRR